MHCAHVSDDCRSESACIPLSAHGEPVGMLHLAFDGAPDARGEARRKSLVELGEALAAQVALALSNLKLRDSLREQSLRDALTGLFNRRYLESTLPRELARAQRDGRPLAVFMLDVDHFKRFNDVHGHEGGDAVLRELGKALKASCRQDDLACRFGGEEFTVVLPGSAVVPARECAERFMVRVRQIEARSAGVALPRITMSMGLALYPGHGEDHETLLQAADIALYEAKRTGRDRLVVSGGGQPPGSV